MSNYKRAPVIALAGRQNVGKSTLFNRLTKTRGALVADYPGLTRDRHYGRAKYYDDHYIVIDTGGFTTDKDDPFSLPVVQQLKLALQEADIIYFLVDARAGLNPIDMELAKMVRQYPAKIYVIANKAEGLDTNIVTSEFYRLGFGEAQAISASHGDFVTSMLEESLSPFLIANEKALTEEYFDDDIEGDEENIEEDLSRHAIRIAIIGRPNAGKSTLINSLVGHKQLITSDVSGTTRDAIEIEFTHHNSRTGKNQDFVLVDTAGVRRKSKVSDVAEKFSVIKTLGAIEMSQVTILVMDSSEGISTQEAHLAHYATTAGRAIVVVFNKWDLLNKNEREQYAQEFDKRMSFLKFALPQPISAEQGQGLNELMLSISKAYISANVNMPTKRLNDILQMAVQRQQPPFSGRFRPKLRYAHQGGKNPPIIIIHGNSVNKVGGDYRRYLQNCFIKAFDLAGTPLEIKFKNSDNPYDK